ncbi:DUF4340 domain-containing protein [Dethiosulfatarculus sandiegensis]|uniref:DUF4340 domain-containing protein n=1 Tax=Dethiosulfatarculus sandiegensis TaxID=1429043 RepID=A0A0D2J6S3_9BACT|nr:DUF4340 domain-containing protein [Dethiosulfatarculus sandiegensis]KIX13874.1 hypothetical protein X474_11600 [Dethiosulfatarculus sandiegensis]
MRLKAVVFMIAALILTAGGYYLSETINEEQKSAQDRADQVLLVDGVQEVVFLKLSGKAFNRPIELAREAVSHPFRVTKPIKSPADQGNVTQMVNALAMARIKKRVKDPSNLKDFGLDPPWVRLQIKSKWQKEQDLLLGDLSPTGESLYVKAAGKNEIWLLSRAVRVALNQNLFSLRDKKVLDFVVLDVKEAFWQERNTNDLILHRKKTGTSYNWETGAKVKAPRDDVLDLLFRIHGLRALAFFDSGINLTAVGLIKPWAKMTLTVADAEKKGIIGILLGGTDPSGKQVYIRRLNGGPVMAVDKEKIKGLWALKKKIKKAVRDNLPAKGRSEDN